MSIRLTVDPIIQNISLVIETAQTNFISLIAANLVALASDCIHCV